MQLPRLKLIITAKSTNLYTSDTTLLHTTCSAQPSSSLLAGAASSSPTPHANPTGSARADDANYSATISSKLMTRARARARGFPVKTAAVLTALPPPDQTIFEQISLDEPPRATFEPSTVSESLADLSQVAGATPSKPVFDYETQVSTETHSVSLAKFDKSETEVLDCLLNLPTSNL